jgi:hypothetical protein
MIVHAKHSTICATLYGVAIGLRLVLDVKYMKWMGSKRRETVKSRRQNSKTTRKQKQEIGKNKNEKATTINLKDKNLSSSL